MITQVDKNEEVLGALTSSGAVVAAELAGLGHGMNASADSFLDEAGQLSLANVLAASRCVHFARIFLSMAGFSPELLSSTRGCRAE